jgi:hypothetical protein
MTFNLFEQSTEHSKKRLIKSESKNVKYSATSFSVDNKLKSQASDFYVGIYDSSKD